MFNLLIIKPIFSQRTLTFGADGKDITFIICQQNYLHPISINNQPDVECIPTDLNDPSYLHIEKEEKEKVLACHQDFS